MIIRKADSETEASMMPTQELINSMMAYNPAPLDCHITLFKSQATNDKFDIPEDYGWRPLVKSMDIARVQGKHLTMFAPRHVGALAREISRHLGSLACLLLTLQIDPTDLPLG